MADLGVELREICDADRLTGLKLGKAEFAPLKTFLQRDAKKYHAFDLAKTYGLFVDVRGDPKVIGYITLICADVATSDARQPDGEGVNFRYPDYPAVKIARLAVHVDYQGNHGLGRQLVEFALGLVKNRICPRVGCRFVVVDAKKPSVPFYERMGFTILDTAENEARDAPVMFIDMNRIPA